MIKRVLFVLLYLVVIIFQLTAQEKDPATKKIDLIDADRMVYDENKGADFTRLIGNVIFRHEEVLLYCDSAYLYDQKNSIDAFGNIHIKVSDSMNIYGDSLRYDGNTKMAAMHKNVRMIDNQITLTTDHLFYDIKAKTGKYEQGGKIVDPENTLTSKRGFYYSDKKDFFFNDSVVLVNVNYIIRSDSLVYNTATERSRFYGPTTITSDSGFIYTEKGWYDTAKDIAEFTKNSYIRNQGQTLKGDSIFYNRIKGTGYVYRNVCVTDTVRNTIINSEYLHYNNKQQYTLATIRARMTQIEGSDSLFLHADTLMATFDTLSEKVKVLFAFHHVKFYRTDLQGMCDSLVYNYSDSLIHMYYQPVIWSEDKQLSADTVFIQISNNLIDKMFLRNSCFVISCDDSAGQRFNQVKGLNMTGLFTEGELKQIKVFNNAETIYFMREEDGRKIGINKAISTHLNIRIDSNQISEIVFIDKPVATLYPEKDLTVKDLFLKNFRWLEALRPRDKNDIFRWK